MMKSLFAAAILGLALAAPAYADDMMKCDDASMMKMDGMIKADTDPNMKKDVDMAMKDMEMAKTAMKDGKMDDCMKNMEQAKKDMMMK